MRRKSIIPIILLICFSANYPSRAQGDQGFIYGTIISTSGATYQGQIRWGKEEAYWNDIFNATKTSTGENAYQKHVQKKISKNWWENLDGGLLRIWDDEYSSQVHQFTCRFGDIKSITPQGEGKVWCEFKNGLEVPLQGGSNDFGTSIIINDYELGVVKLRWSSIQKVEFEETPAKLEAKLGEALYGEIITSQEKFSGYVQWDKDERLDTDLIDGSTKNEKLSLPFQKVACIENMGNKSQLKLMNDKSITMYGTNDVNSENRGIVVSVEQLGKVEIPWKIFKSVCFESGHGSSGPSYSSFEAPQRLFGEVKDLRGNQFEGLIIFDRDEKWDFEQLEGLFNEVKYVIPFRNIKTIIPKNEDFTYVLLRNGHKLILGKLQDVSSKNEGVVVITSNSDSNFIEWEQVDEINFD